MEMTPTMMGKKRPREAGMRLVRAPAISVIMPVPFMMPVKHPAAKRTEHIIRHSLAWASTRALDSLTLG